MVEVNEKLTRQVAHLARLELSEHEVETYTAQLGKIIGYVEQLQEVDVHGIEPLTHPLELSPSLREDIPAATPVNGEGKPRVLDSAPDVLYDGYKVPPIL